MYRYYKVSEKLSKLTFDSYNRQDSELTFLEAKIVKSENFLTIYGAIQPGISGKFTNITKAKKLDNGEWSNDPDFNFPVEGLENNPAPLVMIQVPIKAFINDKGKEIKPSVSEGFIAKKLLEDFGDGGAFEGILDLGVDKARIAKYEEYIQYGDAGLPRAVGVLKEFYNVSKIDTLTVVTDDIISQDINKVKSGGGGKNYVPQETESGRLNARTEFVKRFLADDWDKAKDFSVITFDDCLTTWHDRPFTPTTDAVFLLETLKAILD